MMNKAEQVKYMLDKKGTSNPELYVDDITQFLLDNCEESIVVPYEDYHYEFDFPTDEEHKALVAEGFKLEFYSNNYRRKNIQ